MFRNQSVKTIESIKVRLKAGLKDPELPKQRKEEVESLLYYANVWIRERAEGLK